MTSTETPKLLFVNYHYLRDADSYRFPGIHPLSMDGFRDQIRRLNNAYRFATQLEVEGFFLEGKALPGPSIFPTFDDGLVDHWHAACDVLDPLGIKGAFFICSRPAVHQRALTVHKIQWLRAHTEPNSFAEEFFGLTPDSMRPTGNEHWIATAEQTYTYDTAQVGWLKFALNFILPREMVDDIASQMFAARGIDEARFCEQTYISEKQIRTLRDRGHVVGVHGHTHAPFSKLGDGLFDDVEANIAYLSDASGRAPSWVAYPYGRKQAVPDIAVLNDLFSRYDLQLGLTLNGTWNDGSENPKQLNRINTNEVAATTRMGV